MRLKFVLDEVIKMINLYFVLKNVMLICLEALSCEMCLFLF